MQSADTSLDERLTALCPTRNRAKTAVAADAN
jgi:hypothetical protein